VLRESLAMRRKLYGNEHIEVANSLRHLAEVLGGQGKLAEANPMLRETLALQRKLLGSEHPRVANTLYTLANVMHRQGKLDEAEALYRESLTMHRKLLGQEFPSAIGLSNGLVNVLMDQGKLAEAISISRQVFELSPQSPEANNRLAWTLASCPDPKLCDPLRAVELAKTAAEAEPQVANYWNTLGVAQYRAGQWQAAIESLEKSIELVAGEDIQGGATGESWNALFLAMAHQRLGQQEGARQWYDRAVEWMEKYEPNHMELRRFRAEAAELLGIAEPQAPAEGGSENQGEPQ
jgi:tetratricopeptide (TPR) repeat protein